MRKIVSTYKRGKNGGKQLSSKSKPPESVDDKIKPNKAKSKSNSSEDNVISNHDEEI